LDAGSGSLLDHLPSLKELGCEEGPATPEDKLEASGEGPREGRSAQGGEREALASVASGAEEKAGRVRKERRREGEEREGEEGGRQE